MSGGAGLHARRPPPGPRGAVVARATIDRLSSVGFDFLSFLATTVLVIPLFRRVNISPILAFLLSGAVLQQLG
jgi:hypothetical protein